MTERNDGGPAFPRPTEGPLYESQPGMSLRAWLAGQALAGLLANTGIEVVSNPDQLPENRLLARAVVGFADATLTELDNSKEEAK